MDEEQERGTKMKGRTYFYSSTDDAAFFGGTDTIYERMGEDNQKPLKRALKRFGARGGM